MTFRYIVQRATTRETIASDAPVVYHDQTTRRLSKSGQVDLYVTQDDVTQKAADGRLLYEKLASLVTIEENGVILFRGIVQRVEFAGPDWKITVPSITSYPYGETWQGAQFYGAQEDPADLMRMMWDHLQSYPDSNLAVRVVGATRAKVGSTSTAKRQAAEDAYDEAVREYKDQQAYLKEKRKDVADARKVRTARIADRTAANKGLTAAKKIKPKNPAAVAAAQAVVDAAVRAVNDQNGTVNLLQQRVDAAVKLVAAAKSAKDKANDAKSAAAEREREDGGAWTLFYWEATDLGRKIDELATETPLDWYERHYWSGDEPRTEVVVKYPRAGRRLSESTDPTFEQGVNIAVRIEPDDDGDEFANAIVGIGAGEGSRSIRRTVSKRDGRLRKSRVFTDKSEKRKDRLERRAGVELTAHQLGADLKTIVVLDHPNSPRGSYSLGDDIRVFGTLPHFGKYDQWHRIIGITEKRDGTSELELALAESFTYGKGFDE